MNWKSYNFWKKQNRDMALSMCKHYVCTV